MHIFSVDQLNFSEIEAMNFPRSFNPGSGCHLVSARYIYAIGGSNSKDGGEFYDLMKLNQTFTKKGAEGAGWINIPSQEYGNFGVKLNEDDVD